MKVVAQNIILLIIGLSLVIIIIVVAAKNALVKQQPVRTSPPTAIEFLTPPPANYIFKEGEGWY